jgi:hypothetical protein
MVNVIHYLTPCTDRNQIVEKHSALLEVDQEERIPIDADHSMMCKFEADSDGIFEKVYKRIKRMRREARSRATDQAGLSL